MMKLAGGVGGLWAVDEELQGLLVELAVGVDADIGLCGVIFGSGAATFPYLGEAELLQDAVGGRVVGGDTGRQRYGGVDAPDGSGSSVGDLGGVAVAPEVGAEAVLEVPELAVYKFDTTHTDEFGGALAEKDTPGAEVLLLPAVIGALDQLAGLLGIRVPCLRAVSPDAVI